MKPCLLYMYLSAQAIHNCSYCTFLKEGLTQTQHTGEALSSLHGTHTAMGN